jgi:hypothetical protein
MEKEYKMNREELRQFAINHFLENPNTSAKPLYEKGDTLGGGVRGQIAGVMVGLRDEKILQVTGGFTNDVYLTVNKTKVVENEVNEKWEKL